ncbi:uncharacterized protein LOC108887449 isoform X2 [Lates calcarifer]|uniref:Uncharacterized protein LOC108887449 isoform X2 n=1 Tax=Lates calcarifer TaxID=8187 RepID=A0AAJ8B9A1_LATCA|nr:uncharacterized protein LOC108887449 isoform X2 [Lates calcarifer]
MALSVMLLLHLTVVTGQYSSFRVRDGDEVTLPCENLTYSQRDCGNTQWTLSGQINTAEVKLVTFGKIHEESKSKSDRLSLTENCSLVIKKVTAEDAGKYTCRQFDRSGQQQGPDAQVFLFLVTKTEQKNRDQVTLNCSVSTYGWCNHRVKWLIEDKDIRDMKTSQVYCSATVSILTSHYNYTSRSGLFKCEMTDTHSGKVQQFTFSHQSSAPADEEVAKPQGWQRFIIVSVGLAALLIIVVAVNIWAKTKGTKTQMDENNLHNTEGDTTVNYENMNDLYASVRF